METILLNAVVLFVVLCVLSKLTHEKLRVVLIDRPNCLTEAPPTLKQSFESLTFLFYVVLVSPLLILDRDLSDFTQEMIIYASVFTSVLVACYTRFLFREQRDEMKDNLGYEEEYTLWGHFQKSRKLLRILNPVIRTKDKERGYVLTVFIITFMFTVSIDILILRFI